MAVVFAAAEEVQDCIEEDAAEFSDRGLFGRRALRIRVHDVEHADLVDLPRREVFNLGISSIPLLLPYSRWAFHGISPEPLSDCSVLPLGWRRSGIRLPSGDAAAGQLLEWQPVLPIDGVELSYETIDASVLGFPRSDPSPFNLADHGFSWVRRHHFENALWFSGPHIGELLLGNEKPWPSDSATPTQPDGSSFLWRRLWEGGLRDCLAAFVCKDFGCEVFALVPLCDDCEWLFERYGEAYMQYLRGPGSHHDPAQYLQDGQQDFRNSTCKERNARLSSNRFLPSVFELHDCQTAPTTEGSCFEQGRREKIRALDAWPARLEESSAKSAVLAPHVDLEVEGQASHLQRAAEVGAAVDLTPAEMARAPPGAFLPSAAKFGSQRTRMRRELLNCWLPRETPVTALPLAVFHDFQDGTGPKAIVPELAEREIIVWRTATTLHGALPAVLRNTTTLRLAPTQCLGDTWGIEVDDKGVVLSALEGCGGIIPGDRLICINGISPAHNVSCHDLLGDVHEEGSELIFASARENGRRSLEFRFFVYLKELDGNDG